jgi:hypothetical protein
MWYWASILFAEKNHPPCLKHESPTLLKCCQLTYSVWCNPLWYGILCLKQTESENHCSTCLQSMMLTCKCLQLRTIQPWFFFALLRYIKNIIAYKHINNKILVKFSYFGVYLPKEWVQDQICDFPGANYHYNVPSCCFVSITSSLTLARANVMHPTITYICTYRYRYDHVPHCGDILFHRYVLKYIWSYLDDYGAIFCVVLPKYKGWCRLFSMSMYSILLGYLLTSWNSLI